MDSRIQVARACELRVLGRLTIHKRLETVESVSAVPAGVESGLAVYPVGIEAELHRVGAGYDREVIDELIPPVRKLVADIPVRKPCGLRAIDRNGLDRAAIPHRHLRPGSGIPGAVFVCQLDSHFIDMPI